MIKVKELTSKQKRFVEEYLKDFNATQAAIWAGYSKKTAKEIGCENLTKPIISLVIAERTRALTQEANVTVQTVINGLLSEALNHGEGSTQSARVQAWTQLGRFLGMFKDNANINVGSLEAKMREAEKRLQESGDTSENEGNDTVQE